ncbi:MAG TPA: hypothetical protein VGE74_07680 [Gemmata sp.]
MPTATIELTRDGAYIVVAFRPKSEVISPRVGDTPPVVQPVALPIGLEGFGDGGHVGFHPNHPLHGKGWQVVGMRLAKNTRGEADPAPMLAAADWLRDQGWTVEPLGWCKTVFDRIEGRVTE